MLLAVVMLPGCAVLEYKTAACVEHYKYLDLNGNITSQESICFDGVDNDDCVPETWSAGGYIRERFWHSPYTCSEVGYTETCGSGYIQPENQCNLANVKKPGDQN